MERDVGGFYYDGQGVEVVDDLLRARQFGSGPKRGAAGAGSRLVVVVAYSILLVVAATGPMPIAHKCAYGAAAVVFAALAVAGVEKSARSGSSMTWMYAGLIGGFTFAAAYKFFRDRKECFEQQDDEMSLKSQSGSAPDGGSAPDDDEYQDHSILFS